MIQRVLLTQVWRPNPVMWPFSWNLLAVLSLESYRFSVCLEIKFGGSRICMCHLGGANRDHKYRKWPNKRTGRLLNFRGLSERGVYSHNCNKLKETNTVWIRQKYQESWKKNGISTPSIDMSWPSRNPCHPFNTQQRCQNPRSGLLCCHH